jgi:subtilisin family serine protease
MKTPGVTSVEPDYEIRAEDFVEEAAATEQWAHRKVESEAAWRVTRGSEQVIVAVIDGGVDIGHPDLAQNVYHNTAEVINGRDDDGNGYIDDVNGWDYVNGDNNPRSDSSSHFHGSHVAGIIGAVANRSSKLIGHSQVVRILPLKFIDKNGTGNTSNAIRAIDYAIAKGASIINASWSSTSYSSALYAAIKRAQAAGILFVAAAGNDGQSNESTPHYPANYGLSNIISVGASTSSDTLADYSDYGLGTVDFAAPGSGIYSLANGGGYATMSGTSMATPLVTGIAVLVKAHHMSFSYYRLAQSLIMGVDKLNSMRTKVKYGGRINARKALEASDQVYQGKGVTIESADPGPCG